jgi:hypothetical protein
MKNCADTCDADIIRDERNSGQEVEQKVYLRAIGAGAGVGHGEKTLLSVLELEVLVRELG